MRSKTNLLSNLNFTYREQYQKMKRLLFFIPIFSLCFSIVKAQNNLFTHLNITTSQLNAEELSNYRKLTSSTLIKSIHFASLNNLESVQNEGRFNVDLPYLPCHNLEYKIDKNNYVNASNYDVVAVSYKDDCECNNGKLSITNINSQITGNISTELSSFELYSLSSEIVAVCELDLSKITEAECGNVETISNEPLKLSSTDPCERIATKVLFIFNDDALAQIPNTLTFANQCLSQTNYIWDNSKIPNEVELAGIVNYNFAINTNGIPDDDVILFSDDVNVQNFRNAFNAEIVCLVIGNPYADGTNGIVKEIAPAFDDAYMICNAVTATSGRRTFAHEVSHILGAKHDNDGSNPSWARGRIFNTDHSGLFGLCYVKRYTLMALMPDGKTRIDHVSNPNVDFHGKPTGTGVRDNAQRINDLSYNVANFYPDPNFPLVVNVSSTNPSNCHITGFASATPKCGTPPYTYLWEVSNGIGWSYYDNTQSILAVVPIPANNGIYNSAMYRVTVTDANNNQITTTRTIQAWCKGHNSIWIDDFSNGGGGNRPANFENQHTNDLTIFPNPATDNVNIIVPPLGENNIEITITDINGRVIQKNKVDLIADDYNHISLRLNNLITSGVYVVHFSALNFTATKKLIIQ